jgi:hypothetical protein
MSASSSGSHPSLHVAACVGAAVEEGQHDLALAGVAWNSTSFDQRYSALPASSFAQELPTPTTGRLSIVAFFLQPICQY